MIPLNTVKDETFAGEYLGKGVAIQPEQGRVVAPFDGKVTVVMDTKHAIGITSNNGIEILIHVGMDTVQLNGKYYQTHVKIDDEVKKGDLLLTFEKENIIAEGYEITTPVVITNTADFKQINALTDKQAETFQYKMTAYLKAIPNEWQLTLLKPDEKGAQLVAE